MNFIGKLLTTLAVFFLGVAAVLLIYVKFLYDDLKRDLEEWNTERRGK